MERLARAQASAGHSVDVVHCIDAYRFFARNEPKSEPQETPNLTTHGLRSGLGFISPLLSHQTGRPLLKRSRIQSILDQRQPDVIHFHNISLFGAKVMEIRPARGHVVKLFSLHDHWLVCPTSVLWKYQKRPCERAQCFACTLRSGRPPQLWRYSGLLEKCIKEIDLVLTPSRFSEEMHAARGFAAPMERLPHFALSSVEQNGTAPAATRARPYFLFAGRLEVIKGVESLLRAWEKVHDSDLLIAGSGSLETQLRARAGSLPNVVFLGRLMEQELGRYYSHALACIVPSLTYETFANVVLEAFARRTPVIARDLGALPEMVQTSRGGLLYRSEEELLAAVSRLTTAPELRADLAEQGYRAFVSEWSEDVYLTRYMSLIRKTAIEKFGRVPWES